MSIPLLTGDCANCFALCCTAFGFTRSTDFAVDKPAGQPCPNLAPDHTCTIHRQLHARGFRGCTVFDCFGAGQVVSQRLFGGVSRRQRPESARPMYAAFAAVRQLHEMLWYLDEARERAYDPDSACHANTLARSVTALASAGLTELLAADLERLHGDVRAVLVAVSAEVRASFGADGRERDPGLGPGADLAGRDLDLHDLCGADLRGACLIGADLRGRDLAATDLLGADLRGARLGGADLSRALYVTRPQIAAAQCDGRTRLPSRC